MTDKEQIIIDGVDVSKCEFYMHYDYGKFSHGCSLHKDMFGLPVYCDIADCCKDCYFKQLARKTRECERLKERLERTEEDLKYQCVDCMNVKSDRYSKALEEIEKYINNQGINNKWNMRIQRFRMGILDIISRAKGEIMEIK